MTSNSLKIIPLGGLGAIGKNMMALEFGPDIVIIDAGILFPEENMPGVDFAIPDITYLIDNKEKVKALLITHGHEDHIGALPFVLRELDVPVYASRLTHGLISVKLKEHGLLKSARLNVVEPHESFKIGPFRVEFFRVCHSIPDAMGICLTTPSGKLIHTGDFKIDHTPADGRSSDLSYLSQLTDGGVLALCSDSTYAEVTGYTESEEVVGRALDIAISDAKERVIVATFASLISRIQQVIDAAVRHGRHVTVVGNVKMDLPRSFFYKKELSLSLARSYGPGRYDNNYEFNYKGRKYLFVAGNYRFEEAKAVCNYFNLHLVIINDLDENMFINHITPFYPIWLGGEIKTLNKWKWINGTTLAFSKNCKFSNE